MALSIALFVGYGKLFSEQLKEILLLETLKFSTTHFFVLIKLF
jgi:hypothetical protein